MSCLGRYHSNPIMENLSLTNLRRVCTGAGWITTEGAKSGGKDQKGKRLHSPGLGNGKATSCKNNLEANFQLKSPS